MKKNNNFNEEKEEKLVVKIKRHKERYDLYEVPYCDGMSLLFVLKFIYEKLDSSLAYPLCLCRIGKCGNCSVRLNGKNVLACSTIVTLGKELVIEPINNREVIKDLVVKG